MNTNQRLDRILQFLTEHKERINVTVHSVHQQIFDKEISLDEALQLFNKIKQSGKVRVLGGEARHIGWSIDTSDFLEKGGFTGPRSSDQTPTKDDASTTNVNSREERIFLSYCWKNKDIADKIFLDLSQLGLKISKDDHNLKYKDKISDFMESIRTSRFAIIIVSNEYLRSKNCMTEVLHLLKEDNCFEKIMPVIVDGTQLYSTKDLAGYIEYWEQQARGIRDSLSKIDIVNSIEITDDLRQITFISQQIGSFIKEIRDMFHIPFKQLVNDSYWPMLEKMEFVDMRFAVELFRIAHMKNVEEREIALEKYARSNPRNSYYYFLKASTANLGGRFLLAKESYYHAIEEDPANAEAMNNLGMLLMEQFKELREAKKQFENAVAVQPYFTIARLNLGTILSKLNEEEKAKEQYEKIIEYDATEPKAYNNLANYYRFFLNDPASLVRAEELLKRAIEIQPDFLEAYLNLGNLYKTTGRKLEGNETYQKAKEMDHTGKSHQIFDMLIASKKG